MYSSKIKSTCGNFQGFTYDYVFDWNIVKFGGTRQTESGESGANNGNGNSGNGGNGGNGTPGTRPTIKIVVFFIFTSTR